jgi:uncharacterized OB-fold protein
MTDKAASPVLSVLAGLREMVAVARDEGYASITLTDLEHAIDVAEDRALAPSRCRCGNTALPGTDRCIMCQRPDNTDGLA